MDNEKLNSIAAQIKAEAIKEIVQLTLEQINELETKKNEIQNKIKVLKHDLFDLKDGRLDRILERQDLTPDVIYSCVVKVNKDVTNKDKGNPWYTDYTVTYVSIKDNTPHLMLLNNSTAKAHASGSYKLKDGSIKYL